MGVFTVQSAISEVRDEMSLDFAEGKYLNRVAANLGLQRPPFGFNDATWRALAKAIALQPKQIATKLEEVLTIILGPRITQCGAFLEDTKVGDTSATLVSSTQFPQVGTMVIDEGLPTEEVVNYVFIDRYTNRVYFETPLTQPHTAVGADWETGVIAAADTTSTALSVFDVSGFPQGGGYTVCVGRGTAYEQAGELLAVNGMARNLTTFPLNLGMSGVDAISGVVAKLTALPTQENAHYLTLEDVSSLPPEDGHLQMTVDATFTATAGTTSSVTVAGPLTEDVYGGHWVRFKGDVTAALANELGFIVANTQTVLTFANTLPTSPVAGDSFEILANFQYIRTLPNNSVLMRKELPDLLKFAASSEVSVMRPTATVSIAQVQVKGVDWEVFQSNPKNVEILLPKNFVTNDLRSASYIRETGLSGTAVTDAARPFGATDVSVATTSAMPRIGVLTHVVSNNQYAYYVPHCWLTQDAAAGAVTIQVTDTSQFLPTGTLTINGNSVLYSVADDFTLSVAALPAAVRTGDLVVDEHILRIPHGLLTAFGTAENISFFADYDSGDYWNKSDVWPGPYVWDVNWSAHKKQTVLNNSSTSYVSGPTLLSVDRDITATVLEVEDASCFPSAVPFSVVVGENSGNIETLAVQEVSLRSRTYTTTAALVSPGDMQVVVSALSGPTGPLHTFPNGGPYRVVLAPFTATQEVVEVVGTATGPDRLTLAAPATNSHSIGTSVVLLADLLRISPATADAHLGKISVTNKLGLYAVETQTDSADTVRPIYDSVTLSLAGTDFPLDNGEAVFNFGHRLTLARTRLVSVTGSDLTLHDTSEFPTTGYPYTVYLDVGAGPLKEEVLHVVNNDTSTNELTVSHPPVFTHAAGRLVEFRPGPQENIGYTSRVGNVLSFSKRLEIEHTHHAAEYLAPTVGAGYPRNNGYDFPLRLPVTIADRVNYAVNLVRTAGVEITFIDKR